MLGNDIVDLSDLETQPGAQHPRFDSRVFNEEERARLAEHRDSHRLRWSYWAAKEATYKWLRKQDEDVIFSPRSMSVSFGNDSLGEGEVLVGQDRVAVKFLQHPEYVHALVHAPDVSADSFVVHIERMADEEVAADCASKRLRELVIDRFSSELEIDPTNLCVVSEGKIPRLESKGTILEVDLSFSHHGRYAAFVAQRGMQLDRERGAA
jgi:hypothetical protein